MDLAFILAAAEVAVEHEKSEAPFFVLGGVLVLFAVGISVLGFSRPEFPDSTGASRGVMGLGVALVIATMAMIIYVSA